MTARTHPPAFVGREYERALMAEMFDSVLAGEGTCLLIEGEAGIGKTRLLQEMTSHAERDGFRALRGECDEAAGVRPFGPLAQAFATTAGKEESHPAILDLLDRDGGDG